MAYCRPSDDSDVYVFPAENYIECCGCWLTGENERFPLAIDAIRHMQEHQKAGHKVPDKVFLFLVTELFAEIRLGVTPGSESFALIKEGRIPMRFEITSMP